ncbi:MAG: energy transducer TonB [Candidatus Amulumruptor caecigallinarius]|nr:energy transducer TonB [Candidatus Amulumruptor caecigallinarius]
MKRIFLTTVAVLALMGAAFAGNASFPGGETAQKEYFVQNLKYPPMAKQNGIEGVVYVVFTVNIDGSIGNIKIKRMVDPDLESEAIRLVKGMPKWTPATENGAPIESTVELPVVFTLE